MLPSSSSVWTGSLFWLYVVRLVVLTLVAVFG
jgi:hypothetical protein